MANSQSITVYIRPGDPQSDALLRYLDARKVAYASKNIETDVEGATAIYKQVGRVAVPTIVIGDKMLVGFDPVQLARFLPHDDADKPAVSFGAAVRTATAEITKAAGLPAPFGVEVGPVKEDSPAAAAGISSGDIISAIGAYTLTGGAEQFRHAIAARRPGDSMTLTVWHQGQEKEVQVQFPAAVENSATQPGVAATG